MSDGRSRRSMTAAAAAASFAVNEIVFVPGDDGKLLRGFLAARIDASAPRAVHETPPPGVVVCLDIRHRHVAPNKDGVLHIADDSMLLPYTTDNVRAWESQHANDVVRPPFVSRPQRVAVKCKRADRPARGGKTWRNLKQIIKQESSRVADPSTPTYTSLMGGPATLRPAKKYCDLTGRLAKYEHPRLHLRYSSSDQYAMIEAMPKRVVEAYLDIRKANNIDIK